MFGKILAVAFLLTGLFAFMSPEPLPIGSEIPMPKHKMLDISGTEISMKDAFKEKGLLVMFSCNTCPYVVKYQDRTVSISNFAQKMNVGVIVLNSNEAYRSTDDSYSAMQSYAKEQQYTWRYVVDKDHLVADAFGANRTPECYLFNADKKLVYHGAIDDNPSDASAVGRQHLKEAILELTNGKEITIKESKSVGCTIKRKKS